MQRPPLGAGRAGNGNARIAVVGGGGGGNVRGGQGHFVRRGRHRIAPAACRQHHRRAPDALDRRGQGRACRAGRVGHGELDALIVVPVHACVCDAHRLEHGKLGRVPLVYGQDSGRLVSGACHFDALGEAQHDRNGHDGDAIWSAAGRVRDRLAKGVVDRHMGGPARGNLGGKGKLGRGRRGVEGVFGHADCYGLPVGVGMRRRSGPRRIQHGRDRRKRQQARAGARRSGTIAHKTTTVYCVLSVQS